MQFLGMCLCAVVCQKFFSFLPYVHFTFGKMSCHFCFSCVPFFFFTSYIVLEFVMEQQQLLFWVSLTVEARGELISKAEEKEHIGFAVRAWRFESGLCCLLVGDTGEITESPLACKMKGWTEMILGVPI